MILEKIPFTCNDIAHNFCIWILNILRKKLDSPQFYNNYENIKLIILILLYYFCHDDLAPPKNISYFLELI